MFHSDNVHTYGFRIVGSCYNDRRLIDWPSAFAAYSQCDDRAQTGSESYLSAFTFGADFAEYLRAAGTTRGFAGTTCAAWLWFDIDSNGDLHTATSEARRLATWLAERYSLTGDELLIFFSGSKGYHVGLPTALWGATPAKDFNTYCRRHAEAIAAGCRVTIDSAVYDRVRAFRAPNSRHPKTGCYKRFLGLEELLSLRPERIVELAKRPEPFDLPGMPSCNAEAVRDWASAVSTVRHEQDALSQRRLHGGVPAALNRTTLDVIRDKPSKGDRHRLLFSAAANLAEFNCSFELAYALLSETALDSGLPPSEVRRQIECGLNHHRRQP
jgi:hypothetical protein